jgi:hypothetical protein
MMQRAEIRQSSDDRSIGELFGQLASDTGTLIRQEIRLALAETRQNVRSVASASVWLAFGFILCVISLLAAFAGVILLLALWMPGWLAALVTAAALATGGLAIANYGWSTLKRAEIAPEDSIASIKEDAEWLKEQIKN